MSASRLPDEAIAPAGATSDIGLLLYDYFKHLSTLALVALGGTLSIAEGKVEKGPLALVVLSIGLGGGLALMGLLAIVRESAAGRPLPRSARWLRLLSGSLFSFGIGMFLVLFVRTM